MPSIRVFTAVLVAVTPAFALPAPHGHSHTTVGRDHVSSFTTVQLDWSRGVPVGPVTIDGVTFPNMVFDTGSNDIWIKGSGQGEEFEMNVRTKAGFRGTVQHGKVRVGSIMVNNQAFGVMHHLSPDLRFDDIDGIIGLGPAMHQLTGKERSWLSNVMGGIAEPIFSIDLDSASSTGLITFGTSKEKALQMTRKTPSVPFDVPTFAHSDQWEIQIPRIKGGDAVLCALDTMDTEAYDNPCTLGRPFWDNWYTVFDYARQKVTLLAKQMG